MTAADLIAFENRIKAKWEAGDLPCLLHLCGGDEEQLIEVFQGAKPGDWFFASHRNHYAALLAGIPEAQLEQMIDEGRSMFVYDRSRNFLSSAILAGTCGIAAGVALDIKLRGGPERVWCFLGDGAVEEGHFWESALFVEGHDLPCTFVVSDNGRQVDTDKTRRGNPEPLDRMLDSLKCVRRYTYEPTWPHAGSGCKHKITFKPEAIQRMRRVRSADN
jgi:TPP-dependent pyruvate/acetoin dehydrogenase alpha subunit